MKFCVFIFFCLFAYIIKLNYQVLMKKIVSGFIVVIAFAGYNLYASINKEVKLSRLALANVEALARDESSSGNKCTVISYEDVWSGGCLYYCAKCAEGHYQVIALRHCNAR